MCIYGKSSGSGRRQRKCRPSRPIYTINFIKCILQSAKITNKITFSILKSRKFTFYHFSQSRHFPSLPPVKNNQNVTKQRKSASNVRKAATNARTAQTESAAVRKRRCCRKQRRNFCGGKENFRGKRKKYKARRKNFRGSCVGSDLLPQKGRPSTAGNGLPRFVG